MALLHYYEHNRTVIFIAEYKSTHKFSKKLK